VSVVSFTSGQWLSLVAGAPFGIKFVDARVVKAKVVGDLMPHRMSNVFF